MSEWERLAARGHPEPGSYDRTQHVLRPLGRLAPCPDRGCTQVPLVHRPLGRTRRVVQCLGCGFFFTVPATATDAEIEVAWNARAG